MLGLLFPEWHRRNAAIPALEIAITARAAYGGHEVPSGRVSREFGERETRGRDSLEVLGAAADALSHSSRVTRPATCQILRAANWL